MKMTNGKQFIPALIIFFSCFPLNLYAWNQVSLCVAGGTGDVAVFNGTYTVGATDQWSKGGTYSISRYGAYNVAIIRADLNYTNTTNPYLYNNDGLTGSNWLESGTTYNQTDVDPLSLTEGACAEPVSNTPTTYQEMTTAQTLFLMFTLMIIYFILK